jgi:1,4-alpha-glucan branching enzyme
MIQKNFLESGGRTMARVTFSLPSSVWAGKISLVGDFNGWDSLSHVFTQDREGTWRISVDLQVGRSYQFCYLRDGTYRMYDAQADDISPLGSHNFIVITEPN